MQVSSSRDDSIPGYSDVLAAHFELMTWIRPQETVCSHPVMLFLVMLDLGRDTISLRAFPEDA